MNTTAKVSLFDQMAMPDSAATGGDTAARGSTTPEVRQTPHNLEAEQNLLGALLFDNGTYEKISDFLKAEHFYSPAHGRIFAAINKLVDQGMVANPITLKTVFSGDADLQAVGGAEYLKALTESVVSIASAKDYADTIYELFLRRCLVKIGDETTVNAVQHTLDSNAMHQIEEAENKLYSLAERGESSRGFVALKDSVAAAIKMAERAVSRNGHVSGITTGLRDLDSKLGGLQRSDLIILAGRPSMGKTALATNMAVSAAEAYVRSNKSEGGMVAFFSLEMSAEQLAARILANETEISSDKMRKGELHADDFPKFVMASQKLAQMPLYIDDTPALSISAVRTRARRLKRRHGLDLIVVDYLQLLHGSSSNSENRVVEISEISRGLKALAKDLDVPVMALSQLSRAVEQREDKRPQLSDLRESGSIEQDADVVMFVFREQYYHERAVPMLRENEAQDKFNDRYAQWASHGAEISNVADIIIAKQRHGPIGTVKVFFDGQFTRFADLDLRHGG